MTMQPLILPNPLTADYTPPPGTYALGPQVNVSGRVNLDLSKCDVIGTDQTKGYLLHPLAGSDVTVQLPNIGSTFQGIALAAMGPGARAKIRLEGGYLHNVVCGVNSKADGSRMDASMDSVLADGMGAGLRVYGSGELVLCHLSGGANPAIGDSAAVHTLDLNATGTVVDDQELFVRDSELHGFIGPDFHGDLIVGEESNKRVTVLRSKLYDCSDAMLDTKAALTVIEDCDLYGQAGVRMFDVHTGQGYSLGNRYTVQAGVFALQTTSGYGPDPTAPIYPGLISDGDTFDLADNGAAIARAQCAFVGSTGFTAKRVGVAELIHPTWTGPLAFADLVRVVNGVKDGVTYRPRISSR